MRRVSRCILITLLLIAGGTRTVAQQAQAGRITGRIIDAATGKGVPEMQVGVTGGPTAIGTQSGVDGRFSINGVPAGTVTLQVRRIGYSPKTVTGIFVEAGKTVEQNISVSTGAAIVLTESRVTATVEKGTSDQAIDQQKTSVNVVNTINAEQIARSPDGDAAQTMKRVSGVTVQDGKFPTVRGMEGRYTTSSLNGARMPSPEPERRAVPLDMFPSGLLQTITATKTFSPDQPGDFSGAMVDIKTKEFPARRSISMQLGSGYSTGATGARVPFALGVGGERFAMVNSDRAIPPLVASIKNFQQITLSQGDMNMLVSSFRNAWTPIRSTGAPLANGSMSIGGNDPILFGHRVGYLVSGTISSSTDVRENQTRALADRGTIRGETIELDRFTGQTVSQGVLWGGIANLSTYVGTNSRLSFNGLYNRSSDNDARIETGSLTNDGIARARITRMQYVERGIYSGQLSGEHTMGTAQRFEWSGTASGVRRYEPDRSEFVQSIEQDTPGGPDVYRWLVGGTGGAVRTFSNLAENSHEYLANYRIEFGPSESRSSIKIGGLVRGTSRDAQSLSFAITARNMSNADRALAPEQIFDGRFTGPGAEKFIFAPLAQGGSYAARDQIRAGFAMAEIPLGSRLRLLGGARYESDELTVDATSTLGSPVSTTKIWNDLLPALSLNLKVSDRQQLRFSASRTLARPEYRELSPIVSRDVVGGENVRGDENLRRTLVNNADLRWEFYPRNGETYSVALFAKQFTDPIERVYGAGSGGTSFVFFTNADRADNVGIELEVRKDLDQLGKFFEPFTFTANATVMQSEISLADSTQASATNLNRRMVGQAPYVINASLTWNSRSGASTATLLFNRVGERIVATGSSPLPDVIEQPRNVVDLSLRWAVSPFVTFRADAKNLLDSPYQVVQGTVVRDQYVAGRTVQGALIWRP
jgi:outer membrane receptor protein involved in Fe transport